jgi:hypothetical protein
MLFIISGFECDVAVVSRCFVEKRQIRLQRCVLELSEARTVVKVHHHVRRQAKRASDELGRVL